MQNIVTYISNIIINYLFVYMFVHNINILYMVVCLFMQHSDIYEDILTYKHMYIECCYKPRQMTFLCNYKRTYVLAYIHIHISTYLNGYT